MEPESRAGLTRRILENLRSPQYLDDHPWVNNRFVQDYVAANPVAAGKSPGHQLAAAVAHLFSKSIPGAPPRQGKRLDTQWAAYGILAARDIAPFLFGLPYPDSFRNAWGKMDEAILQFRFGPDWQTAASQEEIARYRLVGDEQDVTPISTISDWYRKGIEQLADAIQDREQYLNRLASETAPDADAPSSEVKDSQPQPARKKRKRWIGWLIFLLVLALLGGVAYKGWRVYQRVQAVRADLPQLQSLASDPLNPANLAEVEPTLQDFRADLNLLQAEASPYLGVLGPVLKWVPTYGEDLAVSADLLNYADQVTGLLQTTYQAAMPVYQLVQDETASLDAKKIITLLNEAQPQLTQAQQQLEDARASRAKFDLEKMSPYTAGLLGKLDQPLDLLDNGLAVALSLPKILGASSDGPKTYMLLVQNEDELRPTGGFITSVGTFVVQDGKVISIEFTDSGELEDWSLPYPDAPWQLRDYMNSPVLVLRDANWYTDYPTTVRWVEYLYAYTNQHSVDGVIAIDQQVLVSLLRVIGPLMVKEIDVPITADNVVEYMREAKKFALYTESGVIRKPFIGQIGSAIIEKLILDKGKIDWRALGKAMLQNLRERHLLVQFDDPQISAVLADWDMDGAVRPGQGDFLMVVDSNIGFNKTNAAVKGSLTYDVDLTDLSSPASTLVVFEENESSATRSCIQYGGLDLGDKYPIYYCYYNYMRVYLPAGTQLTDATPHHIPADWMALKQSVPAQVDTLEEEIAGVQAFGTLVVVPGGQAENTRFQFALPPGVVQQKAGSNSYTYSLKVQKQPGTQAVPITIRIHLPASARVTSLPAGVIQQGSDLLLDTSLRMDVLLSVEFDLP